jgi:hypothetical protein
MTCRHRMRSPAIATRFAIRLAILLNGVAWIPAGEGYVLR